MKKKYLVDAAGIVLLACIVAVGYWLSPLSARKADVVLQPNPGCDLQRTPCSAALPEGGTVSFAITPRPIPMVAPLQLEVAVSGREASQVEVDFAGVDMNMGLNRPRLEREADGRFRGQGTLPVCVSGGMEWQATVFLESGGQRYAVPFRFASNEK